MLKKIGLVVVEYLYAPIIYSIAKKKVHIFIKSMPSRLRSWNINCLDRVRFERVSLFHGTLMAFVCFIFFNQIFRNIFKAINAWIFKCFPFPPSPRNVRRRALIFISRNSQMYRLRYPYADTVRTWDPDDGRTDGLCLCTWVRSCKIEWECERVKEWDR